jgi:HAD superfamily hydrolase (TIGR01490 family)
MKPHLNSSIAFFDFDGTITSKDTLAEILKFTKGKFSYYSGLAVLSPVIIAYKLNLMPNQRAKEILLAHYFKGIEIEKFDAICEEFSEKVLPYLFRKNALQEIRSHLQNDTKVVIVSASPENWILPWCKKYNIECIATKLQVQDGKITGKIEGHNCYGNEKVKNILKKYNLSQYSKIYAYGDTRSDLPMLSLSTDSFYKPFKEHAF